MGSVSRDQALLLSHCGVGTSRFESLTTDGFFPLLPVLEIEGDCVSYPVASGSTGVIAYVSSGGTLDTNPVTYVGQDYELERIVSRVALDKDLATNVSLIHSVLEDQALAKARLLQEVVCRELWAPTPSVDAPAGMSTFAAQNPAGLSTPAAGDATPLTVHDLRCLRHKVSPWLPDSPLFYVLPTPLYFQVHDLAWASGAALPYDGYNRPLLDGVPLVACDHIQLNESGSGTTSAYLVRVGQGGNDPAKVEGVCRVHPKGRVEIEVGPVHEDDGADDVLYTEIMWNIAFANFSSSSVARLEKVGPMA